MTIANYFVAEMKVNSSNQKILVSFKRIPTGKEKKQYEIKLKARKQNQHMHLAQMAGIIFTDPYGEAEPNYDLAFPTMYMVIKVKDVQKRKLTIGSVVAFNVPEDPQDILQSLKIDE